MVEVVLKLLVKSGEPRIIWLRRKKDSYVVRWQINEVELGVWRNSRAQQVVCVPRQNAPQSSKKVGGYRMMKNNFLQNEGRMQVELLGG